MTKTYRELTGKEKRHIKKLVVSKCPTTTRNTAACRWTANVLCLVSALPTAPCASGFVRRCCQPHRSCKPYSSQCPLPSVKNAASTFRRTVNVSTARTSVPLKQGASKRQQECASTGRRNTMSNRFALEKPYAARLFGGRF